MKYFFYLLSHLILHTIAFIPENPILALSANKPVINDNIQYVST